MMKKHLRRTIVALVVVLALSLSMAVFADQPLLPAAVENPPELEYMFPDQVREWFDAQKKDMPEKYDTPAFDGQHGSEKYGEVGWWTTQEEMMEFLRGLPQDNMKMNVMHEFPVRNADGTYEMTYEWPLLVFSKPSVFTPEDLHALGKPVLWFQGQIHGNEPSAGEAMLVLAKKLADGELDEYLEKVSIVMIPRYNVDGAYFGIRGTNAIRPFQTNIDQNRDNVAYESPITRSIHSNINRYKPHVFLDAHEMGYTYTLERIGEEIVGVNSYHLFDIAYLTAPPLNVPEKIRTMAEDLFEANVITDLAEKGMYSFYYMYGAKGEWRDVDNVYDYKTGELVPGQRQFKISPAIEGNPDEGITDPSMGLKGMVSLLFENRRQGTTVSRMGRVYAHVEACLSLIKTAAENAEDLIETIESGREELVQQGTSVDENDQIVLWTAHGEFKDEELKVLAWNEDHTDLEIRTELIEAKRTTDMSPIRTTVRPSAYLIAGDPGELAPVMERLSYTGVKIDRLNDEKELEVEAQIITEIGAPFDGERGGSAMSGLKRAVNDTETVVKTKVFPKDTYVVRMDQTTATLAALALEPLGNRSYANYWLSRDLVGDGNQGGPHGGRTGFLRAVLGEEFQVYRYLGDEKLDTYEIVLDQLPVNNTMIRTLVPLTKEETAALTEPAEGSEGITPDYVNKFTILPPFKTDVLDEEGPSFNLMLPANYKELEGYAFYLYDWDAGAFVKVDEAQMDENNWIKVTDEFISDKYEVVVAAAK